MTVGEVAKKIEATVRTLQYYDKTEEKPVDGRTKQGKELRMNKILIIDDDRELCALIKRSVQSEHIEDRKSVV